MRRLADNIEVELRAAGTPERAAQEKRYLKSDLEHLGVTVPAMRKVVVAFRHTHPELGRAQVVALARALIAHIARLLPALPLPPHT